MTADVVTLSSKVTTRARHTGPIDPHPEREDMWCEKTKPTTVTSADLTATANSLRRQVRRANLLSAGAIAVSIVLALALYGALMDRTKDRITSGEVLKLIELGRQR